MAEGISAFDDYWNEFVHAHRAPTARKFLFAAVSAGIGSALVGLVTRRPTLVLLAPVIAFLPPWLARRGQQGPSDDAHPLYFALASLKMWHKVLMGAADAECERVADGEPPEVAEDESVRQDEASFPRPNMVTDHTLH
jgi:hypothetical protein